MPPRSVLSSTRCTPTAPSAVSIRWIMLAFSAVGNTEACVTRRRISRPDNGFATIPTIASPTPTNLLALTLRAGPRKRNSASGGRLRPCRTGREPVVAGAARDDRPDIDDDVVPHDVERVVAVDRARRVPGHERDAVAHPQRRTLWRGEQAVFLVRPEHLEVMADDRHVEGIGDGLVAHVHDDLVALPADHGGL